MKLLKSQELALKQAVLQAGTPLDDIALEYESSEWNGEYQTPGSVIVRYRDPRFHLQVFPNSVAYAPGYAEELGSQEWRNWNDVISVLGSWLTYLKRELEAEAELAKLELALQRPGVAVVDDIPQHESFSAEEKDALDRDLVSFAAEVGQRFDAMKAQVADVQEKLDELSGQQSRVIAQVQYLIDASERLGKKDWIMTALGVFSSMAVSAVIPPELARELWIAFVSAISNVAMVRQLPGHFG